MVDGSAISSSKLSARGRLTLCSDISRLFWSRIFLGVRRVYSVHLNISVQRWFLRSSACRDLAHDTFSRMFSTRVLGSLPFCSNVIPYVVKSTNVTAIVMGKAIAMINGEALSLMNLSEAASAMTKRPDRSKEMVSLHAICLYFFTSFGGVLISHVQQLPAALIMAWVGFGIVLLLKLARPFTKCDMLAIGCMCAWVPLTYFSWSETSRFVVSELAAAIIVLQAIHLTWRICSFTRKETMGESIFYGLLHSLFTFFRLLSMFLLFRSLRSLSTPTSFYYALASCLFFAYAVWLGRHQHDDRGMSNGRKIIYTCSSGSKERPNFWFHALLVVILHAPTAFSFLSFFTHMTDFELDMEEAASFLFDATLFCFASALYFQVMFLTPIRIHVVSDGTILIETFGGQAAYGYDPKAIRVFDGPIEDLPEATDDRCHVFCETGMTMTTTTTVVVVVELTDDRHLYLTPKYPEDLVAAVRRSLEMVDGQKNNNKQQPETVIDLERQESKSLTGSVNVSTTL